MSSDLGPILKAAYPQVVATLTRILGDIDRASDATQDAIVKALQVWQVEGIPDNPSAWLVTVGRNRAFDILRRDAKSISLDIIGEPTSTAEIVSDISDSLSARAPQVRVTGDKLRLVTSKDVVEREAQNADFEDDLLRLMFTCCHPALSSDAQIALVLKVVLGLSTQEIGRSLLVAPAAIEKRITRAKQKLKAQGIGYEVPSKDRLGTRINLVLQAIYLLFNEGFSRMSDEGLLNDSIIEEALRLARMMCRLVRHNPEPRSLLALMLLSAARRPGRMNDAGEFVPLHEQDRHRWDANMIREGIALIDAVYVSRHPPSAYQIQAAISAIHCKALFAQDTDWPQIVALYEKLQEYDDSPVVLVNQAVAQCFAGRCQQGLSVLHGLAKKKQLVNYQPYYAALAFAYVETAQYKLAYDNYTHAIQLANHPAQKRYLVQQQNKLLEKMGKE